MIEKFEDLMCWQEARKLVKEIYKDSSSNATFSKDYALRDQMRRAAISILSNISEGFGAFSNQEFIRYLSIASSSATELQGQLYVALDLEYIATEKFNHLYELIECCRKLCKGMIRYLNNHKKPRPTGPQAHGYAVKGGQL